MSKKGKEAFEELMRDIYKYYDKENNRFDDERMAQDIKNPEILRQKKLLLERYYREEHGILFPDI